jgi:flagellar biosynthesis/type III secretory pathway chaperone
MHNVNALLSLLEDERQLILAGKIDALPNLANAKSQALSQLGSGRLSQAQISRLQTVTARNQSLLAAAAEGIRSAQNRLRAIRNPDPSLKTYTRAGTPQVLSRTASNFEKRA